MNEADKGNDSPSRNEHTPYKAHLPGFIGDEAIGLGDAIRRTASYFGVKPCGSCEKRATALNRWMVFTNGNPR